MAVSNTLRAPGQAAAGAVSVAARETCCVLVRDLAGMRELAGEWRDLERRAGRDTHGFQSFTWNMAWAESFLGDGTEGTPLVIVLREKGRARLIWPLMKATYVGGVRAIAWLSDPYCQYGDVLSDLQGKALDTALDTALDALRGMNAHLLRLRHVRDDATIAPFLRARFARVPEREGAPWLDLSPFFSPDDLDRRYNKNQRRRRKRIVRDLRERFGGVPRLRMLENAEELRVGLHGLVEEKRAWLKRRGLVSRALFHERMEAFLATLFARARRDAAGFRPVISAIVCDGAQISWELGFQYGGRHYAYIMAQRPEATELSAARLHMDWAQRWAIAENLRAFDLLVPDTPRKRKWSSGVMPVSEYFLPLGWKGHLFGRGYLCHLRPWMRRAYHAAPMGLRRWLKLMPFGGGQDGGR